MNTPKLSAWTQEKSACIDWSSAPEILLENFTLLQMSELHPKLQAELRTVAPEQRRQWSQALLGDRPDQREAMVKELMRRGLFTPRSERWCALCGLHGHTRSGCQFVTVGANRALGDAPPGTAKLQFQEHLQVLERLRLASEKQGERDKRKKQPQSQVRREGGAAPPSTASGGANASEAEIRWTGIDDRHRGVITKIDFERGFGNVVVGDGLGEMRFFLDRCEYGLKKMGVNDVVTVRVDSHREFPMAIEVRPEKSGITSEDAQHFLGVCSRSLCPMGQVEVMVTHRYDWPGFWAAIPEASLVSAVKTIVTITTFVGNKEPVHLSILQLFLGLLQTDVCPGQGPSVAFFPDLLIRAVSTEEPDVERAADHLLEAASLCLSIRQFTGVAAESMAAVVSQIEGAIVRVLDSLTLVGISASVLRLTKRKLAAAQQRVSAALSPVSKASPFPSALELSRPSDFPDSIFNCRNLPILGSISTTLTTVSDSIEAHCRLLRADTFEAVSRVLCSTCFAIPDYTPSEDTKVDCCHARVYDNLRFRGRVLTRDRDFTRPDSYLIQLCERKPEQGGIISRLSDGTCVCITTGQDRSKIESGEIFWGVVSSSNINFLRCGVIVVSPLPGENFSSLAEKLSRNECAGMSEKCSLMLETNVFVPGYVPVFNALYSFVGPAGMPLPLSKQVLTPGPTKVNCSSPLVSYVPLHAKFLIDSLVQRIRSRFVLDAGQDEAMCKLSTAEALLIQGPPGTGKSFIGARLVEVFVRYKQILATGDCFGVADIETMPSTRVDAVIPRLGPVVVITYKNHALDEFLLDLLRADMWDSEATRTSLGADGAVKAEYFPRGRRIVRVGAMSREPELEPYNLTTMMQQRYVDKFVINGLREKIFLMNQRLEKIAREIQHLERGNVPRSYFERWLTQEQRTSIRYEDREQWLAGEKYIARDPAQHAVSKTLFLTLVRSNLAALMMQQQQLASTAASTAAASSEPLAADDAADEGDDAVQLSVFQQMRKEDESREHNEQLHTTYISAEALHTAEHPPQCPPDVPAGLQSLWSLSPRTRHEYYAYLIQQSISAKARDWKRIVEALQTTVALRNHAMDQARLELLRGADVVGFTTSGCALNQNLLRSLKPSVLVVEEAAEVLESQLLACMTDSLKQIILIGDHFQLKPKVDTMAYEKFNKMNLSMFERIAQSVTPIRLVEQRRMHPTLSRLIRPFYAKEQPFLDHPSLATRYFVDNQGNKHTDNVPGLAHRLFLWRHEKEEEQMPNSLSKINTCEIRMTTNLVSHLISEGVSPKSITVITPYLGQFRAIRSALRIDGIQSFSDVRVCTVDLFQGDECDVIILSLVRTKKLTEFLRMRNRMIVACSRARFAMVVLGNDQLLRQSPHWAEVLTQLESDHLIGDMLPITTVTQPGKVIFASSKEPWPTKKRARTNSRSSIGTDE
jgi:hypothetical protein